LKPVGSPFIAVERRPFTTLEEFFELSALSDRDEYTVAWIDCLERRKKAVRGIFMRGNHMEPESKMLTKVNKPRRAQVCFDAPSFLVNRVTMRVFNSAYYYAQFLKKTRTVVHYEPFFYPLDSVEDYNRLYGKQGYLQYQCVVPQNDDRAIRDILTRIDRAGLPSFLGVLKVFGTIPSPGILSFPRPGVTLALDFPNKGSRVLEFLDELDDIVRTSGGAVYPAKDARMSAKSFQTYFPQWREFTRFIDPKFSSSFWRRVANEKKETFTHHQDKVVNWA